MIEVIISVFIIWNIFGLLAFVGFNWNETNLDCLTPKRIYKKFKVNRFGCAVIFIFENLLCPLVTITYWFWWLCTVGRDD